MQSLIVLPENAPRIAVAVSGGADSMALAHMLSTLHDDVYAITVDHGLRPESAAEAAQVATWISTFPNTKHITLTWNGDKPGHGIQQSARDARYALMADYCAQNGIQYLALAHHRDDQVETFFMRLTRGSGVDGLASMRERQSYNDALTLWRPLLVTASHDDLLTYCRDHDLQWVEDPTHESPKYTRNRLRAALKSEGLDAKRIATTARRMERASDALRVLSNRLAQNATVEKTADAWALNLKLLRDEPFELAVRVLRVAIAELGIENDYGARYDRVEDAAHNLLSATAPTALTLGGCILRVNPKKSLLTVMAEISQKPKETLGKSLPLRANGL